MEMMRRFDSQSLRQFVLCPWRAAAIGLMISPETKRVMGVAFQMTRAALRLADRDDPATEMVAKRIIELANAGERDADRLCELALNDLRGGMSATRPRPAEMSRQQSLTP